MIRFPVFEHLDVDNYALLPGTEEQPGIHFDFQNGISIIAGVNGLGKTTLINLLFRLIVGPYELPKISTAGRFGSTARVDAVPWTDRRSYFSQRVVDRAANASATLSFRVGREAFSVTRGLADCRLLSANLNDNSLSSEDAYQAALVESVGVGSFVDLLTVVKFLTFFNEERRDILWDDQAQRQFLRILFAPPDISQRWVALEQKINSADSAARNASAYAFNLKKDLDLQEGFLQANAGVKAELQAAQKMLDADLERQQSLEAQADETRASLTNISRQVERAKLAQDAAQRVAEELRYTALQRLFPSLDDTARYILTHLFGDKVCLACGAKAEAEIGRLHEALANGICPVCHSDPTQQAYSHHASNVVATYEIEKKKTDKAQQTLNAARMEVSAAHSEETHLRAALESVNEELEAITKRIDEQRLQNATLRARLPLPPERILELRKALEQAQEQEREFRKTRTNAERSYKTLLGHTEEIFRAAARKIAGRFKPFATAFLEEECSLMFQLVEDRPSQGGQRFKYPSLKFEMSAATFATKQVRTRPNDVSESQREFVDLAFRMALIEASSNNRAATLVVETPEASLDAIFMRKAGEMLRAFGEDDRRIVVTTNLTSSVMLPSMFGGPTRSQVEIARRTSRVIDLLDVAAPNAAARRFYDEYKQFLQTGIEGRVS